MEFDHYFSNEEINEKLYKWAARFPKIARVVQIGESYEKRPLLALVLTNQDTGPDTSKPAVWLDGNIHACELIGSVVMMMVAHTLVEGYAGDARIRRLLDEGVYYLLPRANPDGAAWALADIPRYVRSGVRRYPYEDAGDGMHQEDINKDGHILQIRIKDPSGDWKISKLDPRMLEKRGTTEYGGEYYRLLPEGRMENYDGHVITRARPQFGLDFNRNFPSDWRVEGKQPGAGPYPVSEPETRAMVDFIVNHPNINLALGYHTFCRVILRSYATKPDSEMETRDLEVHKEICRIGTDLTGYRAVSLFHDFVYNPKDVLSGDYPDWLFENLGIFAYTVELWGLPDMAGIKEPKFLEWDKNHPHEEDVQILKWLEANTKRPSFYDWVEYDHPQLGKVEIGGWDFLFTWQNPPVEYLAAESKDQIPFALALGDLLPKIAIRSLELKRLGEGTYHLDLGVENTGFLPTFTSEQARKVKAVRPVRVELDLPAGIRLSTGKSRLDLGHLEGRSNKMQKASTGEFGSSWTDNRAHCEWVLQGKPGAEFTLKVISERAGSVERKLTLPD